MKRPRAYSRHGLNAVKARVALRRQTLADHVARLLDKLGLDRIPQRTRSLQDVVAEIAAQREATP
jgi:hypothetical protein